MKKYTWRVYAELVEWLDSAKHEYGCGTVSQMVRMILMEWRKRNGK